MVLYLVLNLVLGMYPSMVPSLVPPPRVHPPASGFMLAWSPGTRELRHGAKECYGLKMDTKPSWNGP